MVSTAVGGVPEVLPRPMIKFAEPTVEDLTDALADAIPLARKTVPSEFHAKVCIFQCCRFRREKVGFLVHCAGFFLGRGGKTYAIF